MDRHVFDGRPKVLDEPQKMAWGFDRYISEIEDWHACWGELIEYFYDGRMFSLYEGGEKVEEECGRFALP